MVTPKSCAACWQQADADKADWQEHTPLQLATKKGHVEAMHCLLAAKADVDKRGIYTETPLMSTWEATSSPHWVEVVDCLLQAGADVHKAEMKNGWTPLHWAADLRPSESARFASCMLAAKADVDKPDRKGRTSLNLAAASGYLDFVRLLLQAGADMDKADIQGQTALKTATAKGVNCLQQAGAAKGKADKVGPSYKRQRSRRQAQGRRDGLSCQL